MSSVSNIRKSKALTGIKAFLLEMALARGMGDFLRDEGVTARGRVLPVAECQSFGVMSFTLGK